MPQKELLGEFEHQVLLALLRQAGQTSIPGGGAEVLSERTRRRIEPKKGGPAAWLDVHREAHRQGFRSTATMMYGHVEQPEDILDHLDSIRALQDEHGGFTAFVPWSFKPGNTLLEKWIKQYKGPNAYLRMLAVSRLYLDNFPHVKAYWVMLGIRTAQVALSYGADDLDGTVVHEKIYHEAGSDSPQELSVAEIRRLIEEAGRVPVERDTLYREVVREQAQSPLWRTGRDLRLELTQVGG